MHFLAEDIWTNRILAIAALITAISGFIALWKRQNTQQKQQDTTTNNVQAVAAGVLANTKALEAGPGPNPPCEVAASARAVRDTPTEPAPIPPTNPVPQQEKPDEVLRVQT